MIKSPSPSPWYMLLSITLLIYANKIFKGISLTTFLGFFKRSFCDLALGGFARWGWRGGPGGVGEGLGRACLSALQKQRLKTT